MNAKEVKAALADPDMQVAIEKLTAKAVKAERKRCLDAVKNAELPDLEPADAKIAKATIKTVVAAIKSDD